MGFYLFVFVFVMGSLISVSSSDWVGVWFGLEMNLFSVVPFFSGVGLSKELESVAKYFIVQAVGSVILLTGSLVGFLYYGSIFVGYASFTEICCSLVVLGLVIKMGLVPFHFWVPSVMSGISWVSCLVLSVWQKIVPLLILVSFVEGKLVSLLIFMGCLGSLVGGLGGFLQTQLRVLLGYSSIGHSGWLVAGGMCSSVSSVCYFLIYSAISVVLFYVLSVAEISSYLSLSKGYSVMGVKYLGILVLLLVSLAGLPPTLGFAMKWSVFVGVLPHSPLALAVLVVGSLLSLYYYLCLGFSWYVFSFSSVWDSPSFSSSKLSFFMALIISVVAGYVAFLGVSLLCA